MADKTSYSEKLKDPRWQKRRLEIFNRDNFTCRRCGDTKSTLHVHHKYYENGMEPWDYPEESLITFCEDCHECEQKELFEYLELFKNVIKRSDFFADDIRAMCWGLQSLELLDKSHIVAEAYSLAFASPEIQKYILQKYWESKNG